MSLLQAVALGVVQGLTEFLPISSSAHLVIVPWLVGWRFDPEVAFLFDVLVQGGTLVPLLIVFRADLLRILIALFRGLLSGDRTSSPDARLGWWVAVATVPAVVIGLPLKDRVEAAFSSPTTVFACLIVTALLLFLGERTARRPRDLASLTVWEAAWVGLAQALAIFPGISRSGATIAAGRARGIPRAEAARFSFLMAIPALAGASLVAAADLPTLAGVTDLLLPFAAGFAASALVGYLAIRWLLAYLARNSLSIFSLYCLAVGSGGLLAIALRG